MSPARVGVNGYGVIGKRVADAVTLQPDMELVGIADVATDYRIELAAGRGYPVFGATSESLTEMQKAGLEPVGSLQDLLRRVDVVVDAAPKKIGAANKAMYEAAGVKAIFQGGEKHELAGNSFMAQANYHEGMRGHPIEHPATRLRTDPPPMFHGSSTSARRRVAPWTPPPPSRPSRTG